MTDIDKNKALTNPSSTFDKPADLVTSKQLSPGEKAKALQEWELDARLMDVAIDEGMNKGRTAARGHLEDHAARGQEGAEGPRRKTDSRQGSPDAIHALTVRSWLGARHSSGAHLMIMSATGVARSQQD